MRREIHERLFPRCDRSVHSQFEYFSRTDWFRRLVGKLIYDLEVKIERIFQVSKRKIFAGTSFSGWKTREPRRESPLDRSAVSSGQSLASVSRGSGETLEIERPEFVWPGRYTIRRTRKAIRKRRKSKETNESY